jgi:hypothetical protein
VTQKDSGTVEQWDSGTEEHWDRKTVRQRDRGTGGQRVRGSEEQWGRRTGDGVTERQSDRVIEQQSDTGVSAKIREEHSSTTARTSSPFPISPIATISTPLPAPRGKTTTAFGTHEWFAIAA